MMKVGKIISRILVSIAVMLTAVYQSGAATTYTVGVSGNYTTIAAAEAVCVDGDTIDILDAVHTENNITVNVSVTIKGQGAGQTTVQAAATRGTAGSPIFNIPDIGTPVITFQDMTLKHGDATYGGAISVAYGTDVTLTVERCVFRDNDASITGGGILYGAGSAGEGLVTITDSLFVGNNAVTAGAAYIEVDAVSVKNSTFSGNVATSEIAGIYVGITGSATSLVYNCTFV
ncbi:MAG: hypothetical protein KAI74_01035, partial [Kiritimatiellae bacterium]|nr:hypothetical protein [Kiritimatiellia bacterium]